MTQDYIDVPITLPPSIFVMINEVARHGVFHMLIPPVDTIKMWLEKDSQNGLKHFPSENKQEEFLYYMDSLIPPSLIDKLKDDHDVDENEGNVQRESGEQIGQTDDIVDFVDTVATAGIADGVDVIEKLRSDILEFSEHLQDKVVGYLIPLYLEIRDDLDLDSLDDLNSIKEDNLSATTKEKISDVLFDVLVSVQQDLESPKVKMVLTELEAGDAEYVSYHNLLKDLMTRHKYVSHAVQDAKNRLTPVFMSTMGYIILDLTVALCDGVEHLMEELVKKDRENIPGPQCLE